MYLHVLVFSRVRAPLGQGPWKKSAFSWFYLPMPVFAPTSPRGYQILFNSMSCDHPAPVLKRCIEQYYPLLTAAWYI